MNSKHFTILAGVISIIAGINLASVQSVSSNSLMSTIANGMGWYFIARGIQMIASLYPTSTEDKGANENSD